MSFFNVKLADLKVRRQRKREALEKAFMDSVNRSRMQQVSITRRTHLAEKTHASNAKLIKLTLFYTNLHALLLMDYKAERRTEFVLLMFDKKNYSEICKIGNPVNKRVLRQLLKKYSSEIDRVIYRKSLIQKLDKRCQALVTLHNRYRQNECVKLLGIDTAMQLNPNRYKADIDTSTAEILKRIKNVTAMARLLKAYIGLSEMNFNDTHFPQDQLLSSFAAGFFITSGPLVASILDRFPYDYDKSKQYSIGDVVIVTKLLLNVQQFLQHPNDLNTNKQLEQCLAQFQRAMNKFNFLRVAITLLGTLEYKSALATFIPTSLAWLGLGLLLPMSAFIFMPLVLAMLCLSAIIILLAAIHASLMTPAERNTVTKHKTACKDIQSQFTELTKEHGLFKVKKRLEIGQIAPIAAPTLRTVSC